MLKNENNLTSTMTLLNQRGKSVETDTLDEDSKTSMIQSELAGDCESDPNGELVA